MKYFSRICTEFLMRIKIKKRKSTILSPFKPENEEEEYPDFIENM